MEFDTVEKVMNLYRTAMAKAAAWTAAPESELPFPPETIKEAIKAWAEDLHQRDELDTEAVEVLSLAYRSLARFLSEEDAAFALPAFRKFRYTPVEQLLDDPVALEERPRLEAISERIVIEAHSLEEEFFVFLNELNPEAVEKTKQQRKRLVM